MSLRTNKRQAAVEFILCLFAFHAAQNILLPVHVVIFGFFSAQADQFLQNLLAVPNGGGEQLLSVCGNLVRIKA